MELWGKADALAGQAQRREPVVPIVEGTAAGPSGSGNHWRCGANHPNCERVTALCETMRLRSARRPYFVDRGGCASSAGEGADRVDHSGVRRAAFVIPGGHNPLGRPAGSGPRPRLLKVEECASRSAIAQKEAAPKNLFTG